MSYNFTGIVQTFNIIAEGIVKPILDIALSILMLYLAVVLLRYGVNLLKKIGRR